MQVGIHPSKVVIIKLKLNGDRKELLARRGQRNNKSKRKYAEKDVSQVD